MEPRPWAAAILVAALILGLLAFRVFHRPSPLPLPAPIPAVIDFQGSVRHPGRHVLPGPTVTLGEALQEVGGLSERDITSLSPEMRTHPLRSGTVVRAERDASGLLQIQMDSMPASARLILGIKLDLNQASREDLLCIPRMKPEMAQAIVDRGKEKPWRDLQELKEIKGVGPKTIERWRSHLVLEND